MRCTFSSRLRTDFAQRGGGFPIPADIHGQAGWGSEHLLELWVSLFIAGVLDKITFKDPFQLKQFYDYDSMTCNIPYIAYTIIGISVTQAT